MHQYLSIDWPKRVDRRVARKVVRMTKLSEAPHGWVERFLAALGEAGLTAEQIGALPDNPDLMKDWVDSLPDLDPVDVPKPPARSASPVSIKQAFADGKMDERIRSHLVEHMGLSMLDELAQLCEEELLQIRNFGPKALKRVEQVLTGYGLQLSAHDSGEPHVSFVLPFTGWGVLRARGGQLRVNQLVQVRIVLGQRPPTVDEFRSMPDEERLQLFDEWTVDSILRAISHYHI